ncbi:hypothetical protein FQN53_001381, partial [Emmonsiellopsis sp. PD_33]
GRVGFIQHWRISDYAFCPYRTARPGTVRNGGEANVEREIHSGQMYDSEPD